MSANTIILDRDSDRATYAHGLIVMVLLAVAVVVRAGRIGDPAVTMDEQFYLLVADRMWHGALPYVDIWDRKPILLFLIYAGLRPLSADGIVAYQIGALLFAATTAYFIALIALRFTGQRGACLAGVAYLLYLPLLTGGGGQSPVFYNLFMAIGAWEVVRAGEADDAAGVWRCGLRAMLWTGLAIQVKYTAAVEGVGFGLWLTVLLIQRNNGALWQSLPKAALWALTALAPTLLAAGFYMLIGHGQEFFQANFLSILQVHEPDGFSPREFFEPTAEKLAPVLLFAAVSSLRLARSAASKASRTFLALWAIFAVAGLFAIGNYYDHYALPLLVPTMIICAPLLGTARGGAVGIALAGWIAIMAIGFPLDRMRQVDQSRISAMVKAVRPYAARGCIYVNDGPTILYLLTHSCLPTLYVFPEHLNNAAEARATDAARNMADLLAKQPSAIFVADRPLHHPRNPVTAAMLDEALSRRYTRVATLPDIFPPRLQFLYVRKDLSPLPDRLR